MAYATVSLTAMLAAAAPVWSQEVASVDEELIVVTGTNIRGAEVIGSAVQSLTAEDLARPARRPSRS